MQNVFKQYSTVLYTVKVKMACIVPGLCVCALQESLKPRQELCQRVAAPEGGGSS